MAANQGKREKLLLARGVRLFASLADRHCGNSEGTPCDDNRPKYICPLHKWIQEARREAHDAK